MIALCSLLGSAAYLPSTPSGLSPGGWQVRSGRRAAAVRGALVDATAVGGAGGRLEQGVAEAFAMALVEAWKGDDAGLGRMLLPETRVETPIWSCASARDYLDELAGACRFFTNAGRTPPALAVLSTGVVRPGVAKVQWSLGVEWPSAWRSRVNLLAESELLLESGGGGGGGPARISYERYCKTLAGSFSRTFAKGAYVFKEGDPVDAFFVITSGACEVRVAGPDGKERLIATLGAGDFFGETGLLEGRSVRAASVFATAPLEVLAIDRKVFNEVASVHNSSALSTSMRERAEARQRARLLKVFENMSVSLSQRRRFGKGAVVYQQGSPAQLFYIVNEGELEMSVNKPDGGSVRVKTLRPGDHLGYDAIFSEVHDTTVTCLSEVELTEVTKEVLGDAFSNDRYFSTIFEARQHLREGQLAAASQGEAQILPMMARAAAAGDGVDYSQYESLIKEMAPLEVSHGEAIFQQGDPPEQVYFVSEGQLECEYDPKLDSRAKKRRPSGEAVVGRDGKPRVVATLGPGDHFGETAMLEARKARNLTVRCVTASCVLRAMSMARFSEILRQRPELHFTVQRAAQMRTNQRIRNVVASAADEDLRVVSFAPGETIFRQGDPSDSFYVLESGEVEMSLVPASEEEEPSAPVPVRTCTAGETFGASGLLPGDNVRRNTAIALSPVVVKVMPVKLFKAMVREDGFLQAGLKASGSYVEARAVSELDETLDAEVQKAMAR
mmetsp:Transcript_34556/g.114443  ORF Transcript_34556/g.114443 Transcript_34556/m.114443 type:complete len:728 (+) Transcript_34556:56-2239(+)